MKKGIFVSILFIILLSACGNDLSEGDQEACDLYQSTVDSADKDEINDDEMLEELEEAWNVADSEQLQDSLDDLMIYFEEGEGDLQENVNAIKIKCSID